MRSIGGLVCLSLLVVGLVGCDTEQPLQAGAQEATLTFSSPGVLGGTSSQVLIRSYVVWRGFEDNNGDSQPDGDEFRFCQTFSSNSAPAHVDPASVPWSFTIDVSVIRAGTTSPERITSSGSLAFNPALNLTRYDTVVQSSFVICPTGWTNLGSSCTRTVMDGGTPRTFRLRTPSQLMSPFNEIVMRATSNPLTTIDPATFGLGAGLCSAGFPGDAVIDGEAPPFTLSLESGDTVIIEARQSPTGPSGLNFAGQRPSLISAFSINGVAPNVTGTVATQPGVSDTLRFTYTVR